jgi:hypothetical protein
VAKKRPGKVWFKFALFGLEWETRVAPAKQVKNYEGSACQAICYFGDRWILFSDDLSPEQYRMTLAHEIQHAIEDHADVDYEKGTTVDVHDRWTDQVARGWVYLIRHCPEIIAFLRAEPGALG